MSANPSPRLDADPPRPESLTVPERSTDPEPATDPEPPTGPGPVDGQRLDIFTAREAELTARQAELAAGPEHRRATRVAEGAMLGGVCTGLARHLGWPVMVIRAGFVALVIFQFLGVIAYGALWLLLPPESTTTAPGLEAASRTGLRDPSRPRRRVDWGMLVALGAFGVLAIAPAAASAATVQAELRVLTPTRVLDPGTTYLVGA